MDILDRNRREGDRSPSKNEENISQSNDSREFQNSAKRSQSFTKAVQEKPYKSVTFKMADYDEIELVEKGNKRKENGVTNGKYDLKDPEIVDTEFDDNLKVDFVLVYEEKNDLDEDEQRDEEEHKLKRKFFENSLKAKNLKIKHVNSDLNEVSCVICLQLRLLKTMPSRLIFSLQTFHYSIKFVASLTL